MNIAVSLPGIGNTNRIRTHCGATPRVSEDPKQLKENSGRSQQPMGAISDNLQRVRERIGRAAAASGRGFDDVLMVAISKTFDAGAVAEAADAGQLYFGENRVQEAEPKIAAL